jgi:hypothetical protein
MGEADLPWLRYLCAKRYPERFEPDSTAQWYLNIVLKNPMLFLPCRTENAFLIQMISVLPWFPGEFQCNVVFIAADEGFMWEAVKLCRYGIEWARKRRCTDWRLNPDADFDLAAMAKRFGADEILPRYILRLK